MSSTSAASAAEADAQCQHCKYDELAKSYNFFPLTFETMGPINRCGIDFISEVGHRTSSVTEDRGDTSFLCQRLSVVVQCFYAVCLANSFNHGLDDFLNLPKHTYSYFALFHQYFAPLGMDYEGQ
jgi:hypothetical protein